MRGMILMNDTNERNSSSITTEKPGKRAAPIIQSIPDNLCTLRKARNEEQRSVAAKVGISASALSAYEKGQRAPSIDQAIRLADYYGVSLDDLCGLSSGAPAMPENATKADVARMVTALCECGMLIELGPTEKIVIKDCINNGSKNTLMSFSNDENYHGMLMMIGGEWVYSFAEKYKGLLKLYYDGDIDREVLQAWKEKKFAEYEGDFALCEYEDPFDM